MTDILKWLEPKLVDVPDSLQERIRSAVSSDLSKDIPAPDLLAEVAERLMQETKTAPPDHETAMTLLTADALKTLSIEANAEDSPQRLSEME